MFVSMENTLIAILRDMTSVNTPLKRNVQLNLKFKSEAIHSILFSKSVEEVTWY